MDAGGIALVAGEGGASWTLLCARVGWGPRAAARAASYVRATPLELAQTMSLECLRTGSC